MKSLVFTLLIMSFTHTLLASDCKQMADCFKKFSCEQFSQCLVMNHNEVNLQIIKNLDNASFTEAGSCKDVRTSIEENMELYSTTECHLKEDGSGVYVGN